MDTEQIHFLPLKFTHLQATVWRAFKNRLMEADSICTLSTSTTISRSYQHEHDLSLDVTPDPIVDKSTVLACLVSNLIVVVLLLRVCHAREGKAPLLRLRYAGGLPPSSSLPYVSIRWVQRRDCHWKIYSMLQAWQRPVSPYLLTSSSLSFSLLSPIPHHHFSSVHPLLLASLISPALTFTHFLSLIPLTLPCSNSISPLSLGILTNHCHHHHEEHSAPCASSWLCCRRCQQFRPQLIL